MKLLTTSEKKIILDDWKNALEVYEKYKTLYLIKKNGPVLCGVYLKPVYGGEHYVPIFHTHSMLSQFSALTICTPHSLLNKKMVADSISIKRHKESLQDLVDKFREQCPIAFCGELSFSQLNKLYEDDINTSMIYPDLTMKNHVLLAFWFGYKEMSQQLILRYKEIIKSWPDEAKRRFNGDNAWEEDVRSQMDLDKLNNTANEELAKFKLTKLKDHGLLPD
ncbi:hypothetical protein CUU54_20520 [Pectobacterium polaris]|uniref:hypothetical protein n=1 Tax=Pectobacterium polaris TaxID=2042057 RepID=UPI000D61E61C|nr:hypothetical protein [Pectobacterium polaris]MCU1791219.1 hypothetical protein [Pectobacterium polaris]PWD55548.1 hypothetical protein DF209_19680 [Pectobacterium polaris]